MKFDFDFVKRSLGYAQNPEPGEAATRKEQAPPPEDWPCRPDGWTRQWSRGDDVWHKYGVGFCLTKDLPPLRAKRKSTGDFTDLLNDSRYEPKPRFREPIEEELERREPLGPAVD